MRYAVSEVGENASEKKRTRKPGADHPARTQCCDTGPYLCASRKLDKKTGLHTVLIFLILGVLSGGLSAYKMAKHIIDREKEDEDREKKEQVKQWESRFGTGDGADRPKRWR